MKLDDLRREIDATDEKLVQLLAARFRVADEIGKIKNQQGIPVINFQREKEVIDHIREMAGKEGLDALLVETVFRQIINISRGLQAPRVAFQGEPGAYSQQAARSFFGPGTDTYPRETLEDVFRAVSRGEAQFGTVPVENSLEGSIARTYDLLLESDLKVMGEIEIKISHCLIANAGVKLDDIQKVYSHPQALGQCQAFLRHMKWEIIPTYDTAGSVKLIKEQDIKDGAAIASADAARIYGLNILSCELEDNPSNVTRFFILGKEDAPATGNDKTSLVFSVRHQPGTLYGFLGELARDGLNLTKIESRPTRHTPWEYNFYLDFEGHRQDKRVKKALVRLENYASFIKVLGSYPRASRKPAA